LGRIVDIGAELYAMTAACVRAQMLQQDDPAAGASARDLADAFCSQAQVRVDALFRRLWRNADSVNRGLAKKLLGGGYTWIEDGVVVPNDDAPWIAEAMPGPSGVDNLHHRIH
jgi:hypothetical protein